MNKPPGVIRKREALGARSERRVREILAAAREVFSEQGYEKTTTLEIARQLGISEATIFSYFKSKRDLCMQVIKAWYDEISLVLEQEVPGIDGVRAQLRFVVRKHLITLMQEGTGMCKLVLGEGRSMDDEFAGLMAELKRRYTAPLMKVLAVAQRTGEVRADMPLPLLRDMVYGSMEHVLWDYMVNKTKPEIETTAAQLTEMLWSAFAPVQHSLGALAQFRTDVTDAMRRLEAFQESSVSASSQLTEARKR
jgi:AcrR family transcriptional regulator